MRDATCGSHLGPEEGDSATSLQALPPPLLPPPRASTTYYLP